MEKDLAQSFVNLEAYEKVVLKNLRLTDQEDSWGQNSAVEEETEWHVNNKIVFGGGRKEERISIVLQTIDAGEWWIVGFFSKNNDTWSIDRLESFEGETPKGLEISGEKGQKVEVSEIELLE